MANVPMQLRVSEEFYTDLRLAGDMTEICTALNTFAFSFRIRLPHDQQKHRAFLMTSELVSVSRSYLFQALRNADEAESHRSCKLGANGVTIGSIVQTVFVNRGLDGCGASSNN